MYTRQADTIDVRVGSPRHAPDLADTAANVLAEAMAFCAHKMGVEGPEAVADLLRRDDRDACGYCLYGVAKHVASSLGAMDDQVKAVYVFDYDATPEDLCFGTLGRGAPLVHLIVWTARKTAASRALLAGLDRALAQTYADLFGRPQLESLLDVQMIDDDDVEHRRGHGALLHALHQRPVQVWER
jgi:hypothetical protein